MMSLNHLPAFVHGKKTWLVIMVLSMITTGTIAQINSFPYYEDFEDTPDNWYGMNGYAYGWEWGSPQGNVISSAYSGVKAWVTNLEGQYSNSAEVFLVSVPFDFTSFTNDPILSFYINYDLESCCDRGTVEYSLDGSTWYMLGNEASGGVNWYNYYDGWGGYSYGWLQSSHVLNGLAGESSVYLRIGLHSDVSGTYEGIAIDDISIFEPSADLAVTGIEAPVKPSLTSSERIGFTVQALYATVDAFNVTVHIVGPLTYFINESYSSLNLTLGTQETFYIENVDFSIAGSYDVTVTITTSDFDSDNNQKTIKAHHLYPKISTFPYYENFETGDGGWVAQNHYENGWEYGMPQGDNISNANSGNYAWKTNLDGDIAPNSAYFLYSPEFDFSSFTVDPIISFYAFRHLGSSLTYAFVEYSVDGGNIWEMLGGYDTGERWYNSIYGWSDYSYGWFNHKHVLEGLAGKSSVLLRVVVTSGNGTLSKEGMALDDIEIRLANGPDVFVSDITVPDKDPLGFNETVTLSIGSKFLPVTELQVNVNVSGAMSYQEHRYFSSIDIPEGGFADIEIENLDFSEPGSYYLLIELVAVDDEFGGNNISFWSFFTSNGVKVSSFPYHEYFEANDGNWFANSHPFFSDVDENGWEHGVPTSQTINTAHSGSKVWKTNLDGPYSYGGQYYLYSPRFDFSSLTEDPFISIFLNHDLDVYDEIIIRYSFDGLGWYILDPDDGVQNWFYAWMGNSEGWVHAIHPLTDLAGEPSVFLRIEFVAQTYASDSFDGVAIDDISIGTLEDVTNPPAYVPPSSPPSPPAEPEPGDVTALDKQHLSSGLAISPNPVKDRLMINLGDMAASSVSSVQLTDARGLVISEHHTRQGQSQLEIDTSSMSEGLYLVWITSGKLKVCQKVIKSNK